MGNGAVFANEAGVSEAVNKNEVVVQPKEELNKLEKANNKNTAVPHVENTDLKEELDKTALIQYIAEIELKISSGAYNNKTEESLSELQRVVDSAKSTVVNAKSQKELTAAYNKLVMTVNSKLRNKPVEKKDIPTVDTTNGKETVGKKAENTEKKSDSNSIENTGSNDLRNGKALDVDNAFRTEAVTNKKPVGNIPFSNAAAKDIYVYKGEETNIELSVTDDSGKIKDIRIGEGSRGIDAPGAAGSKINNQYGLTFSSQRNETDGIVATQDNPAKVTITGTVSVPNQPTYTGKLVTRYLVAEDLDGAVFSEPTGNTETANPLPEGYFKLWVREQTQKYDIQAQTNEAGKIAVADVNNLSQADFEKIKNNIKITYNTADDARLLDKNGKLVENASNYINTVTKQGDQIVVTYKDGSTDSVALTSVLRNNPLPTVKVPYSNQAEKQVYVYTGENTDLTFTANDDTTVKDMYLRGPGDVNWNNTEAFGFTTGKIDNGVVTGKGTISDNKQEATIKMTGVTNLNAGQQWTSYVVANDNDNFSSMPAGRDFNALDKDPDAKSKPGYIQFIVKNQTSKYDIATPTEKVAVVDPSNVTEADLEKIKEKLKLEYSNNNDDANLADKKGTNVDDKDSRIKSVTKDDQGNLVVTYKDGSTDKRALSEFVSLDKQPAINAVNKAAEDKIAEINKTPNATDEEKAAAIAKVKADKDKALVAINDANVTTKDAIDKAQNAGTTAIAGDNPVVAKKAAAKADVEAARKAKADAINADKNLTQAEKDAALAKVTKAAEDATKAIDAATTDAAVDTAKGTGIAEIGKVNPVAKENAKDAIANALTAKNKEIDDRKDLTQAEKDAAKAEAKKLADAELTKVNAQPDNAETAEAAATAQKLVNDTEDKGVADVTSVYPIAKEQAKKAVADELAEKEKELDGRKDLTTEEKEAAKKEAQALAKKATDAINAQPAIADTSDKATAAQTAVDTAKTKGVAEVKAVNPEAKVKPEAKKAIDDAATAKKQAIDARTDLSDKAKEALKDEVDEMATEAKKAIDDENVTATQDVKDIKEVAKTAVKGVGEANIPANKVAVKDPSALTADEKAKVLDAVKKVNPNATSVTQDEDGNVTVTTQNGDKVIITPDQVVKKDDLITVPKAGNNVVKPADKTLVKNPASLTPEEKAAIAAKVKEVNPDAVVTVDDKGNTTVSTKDGKTEVIPGEDLTKTETEAAQPKAGNDVVKPASKTVVANPEALTPEEKKAIEDKVKAVNPGATVVVDDKGNATVTTPSGKTAVIPAADLTKTAEAVAQPNAGNDINTPAIKTAVANKDALTDAEKEAVKKAVSAVNPGATVVVDDKGNATVTTKDGKTAVIPAKDLVIPTEKLTDLSEQSGVNIPAVRTLVVDKNNLTPEEIAKIKAAVEAVNPGAIVVVDDKGNATVTTPSGKTATIAAENLVKDSEDATGVNGGNNLNMNFAKTLVADLDNLTDADKANAKARIISANANLDILDIVFDDKGNATVILKDGKVFTILSKDIFELRQSASYHGGNSSGSGNGTSGNNRANNTDVKVDKAKLEGAIRQLDELIIQESAKLDAETVKEANALLAAAKEVFANANATQAEVDAMVKRIEDFMLKVSMATNHTTPANNQATQAANTNQETSKAIKVAKELPNTGTEENASLAALGLLGVLSGFGLVARKKKED